MTTMGYGYYKASREERLCKCNIIVPFSENEMLVIAPECPWKLATLVRSFRSQILMMESFVPVPKMSPSGWNWAQVRAERNTVVS